jgi:proteasome lid subunit RPN8/RPN11
MTEENKAEFLAHAKTQEPREACGLLVIQKGREKLVICKNIAHEVFDFVIDPDDYLKAQSLGEVVGVVHSHVGKPPLPSDADLVNCSKSNLKWYIVASLTGDWFEFEPSNYKAPLVGRQWCHGTLDCYSLIVDYYKEELGIELPDFDREFEWWKHGKNLYIDGFKKAGFFEVPFDQIQKNDVILMQIESPVINHGAIYLGHGLFLQHLQNRLSSRDVFGGFWLKNTVKIVRFKGVECETSGSLGN